MSELEEFTGDTRKLATGYVVESHRDPKQGVSATLVIKNGSIGKGQFVVVEDSITPTRMLQDFTGKAIDEAHFSTPITLVGFDKLPAVGSRFSTFETKKDAEEAIAEFKDIVAEIEEQQTLLNIPEGVALIPVIIKTDVAGTGEAIREQIEAMTTDDVIFKVVKVETGAINESDAKLALSDPNTVIVGFHVDEEAAIKNLNNYETLTIKTFNIIYKLTEWFEELYEERRIKKEVDTALGELKVLKVFSSQKNQTLVGGSVASGTLSKKESCKIIRNNELVGTGTVVAIQQGKTAVDKISGAGTECGIMIENASEILEKDRIQTFVTEVK